MDQKIAVLATNEYIYQKWLRTMFPCHWNKFKYISSIADLQGEIFTQWIEVHDGDAVVNVEYDEHFHEALQSHIRLQQIGTTPDITVAGRGASSFDLDS